MVSIALDNTFFLQIGLFVILVFLLNAFLYKPVLGIIEERRKKISGLEEEAETTEQEVERKLSNYRARIERAKADGNLKRSIIKKEGLDRESELLAAANAEAQRSLQSAKEKIAGERDAALEALRGMSREMGQSIAERALGRSL